MLEIKRALISVWDKSGIVEFARGLQELKVKILSTGGTAKLLKKEGIKVEEVSDYTGASEMLQGRVKTLHPKIHAGILALRNSSEQMDQIKREGIEPIDMIVVNLYPFTQVVKNKNVVLDEALENIDIGGPTLLRAGAKNFKGVAVVSNPHQYSDVLEELKANGGKLSEDTSYRLAVEAFHLTSFYDSVVAEYFRKKEEIVFPPLLTIGFQKLQELRYGENPHQRAAFYSEWTPSPGDLTRAEKIWGKELSFNNLLDFQAALSIVSEFSQPAVTVIKHNNPCGAAEGKSLKEACENAFQGDPVSAFGSIVGLNRTVDEETAKVITAGGNFVEGLIAPDYTHEALTILKEKKPWGKKLIILKSELKKEENFKMDIKKVGGGILVQEEDRELPAETRLKFVTKRVPTEKELEDLKFAWRVCKYVKSNAILVARDKMVVGVGAGQMSRVDATFIALRKAGERAKGAVLASDAFFPFPDAVEMAGKAGIRAIIQPGGALRDKEVIHMADQYDIAMAFTGIRHFRH